MKIRADFVTNSSSSSFVTLTVNTCQGNYTLYDGEEIDLELPSVSVDGDVVFESVTIHTVAELATVLYFDDFIEDDDIRAATLCFEFLIDKISPEELVNELSDEFKELNNIALVSDAETVRKEIIEIIGKRIGYVHLDNLLPFKSLVEEVKELSDITSIATTTESYDNCEMLDGLIDDLSGLDEYETFSAMDPSDPDYEETVDKWVDLLSSVMWRTTESEDEIRNRVEQALSSGDPDDMISCGGYICSTEENFVSFVVDRESSDSKIYFAEQGDAAAQYDLGKMYYDNSVGHTDYEKAFYWYKQAAEQGYAAAQYGLGKMYYDGRGIDADDDYDDYEKAIYWYKQAAEQGYVAAQHDLAEMYIYGEGTDVDNEKAIYWYKKAAEQGDEDAQFNLGSMYDNGEGTDVDHEKAIYWYKKAAEQGNEEAQYNLDMMNDNGEGTDVDDE